MLTFPDSQLEVRKFKIFLNLWNPFSFPIAVLWWSSLYKSYKNSTALVWLSEYWNIHWYFYYLLSPYPSSLSALVSGVLNTLWNGTDLFPRLAVLLCLLKDDRVQSTHLIGGKTEPQIGEGTCAWSQKTEAEVVDPSVWGVPGQIPVLSLWVVFLKGFYFDEIFSSFSSWVSWTPNEFLPH